MQLKVLILYQGKNDMRKAKLSDEQKPRKNSGKTKRPAENVRPWQDSNLQSSDPESDALSIRPQGRLAANVLIPEETWQRPVLVQPSGTQLNRSRLFLAPVADLIPPGSVNRQQFSQGH